MDRGVRQTMIVLLDSAWSLFFPFLRDLIKSKYLLIRGGGGGGGTKFRGQKLSRFHDFFRRSQKLIPAKLYFRIQFEFIREISIKK